MIETELLNIISNNAVGVFFGVLMYRQANGSIKEMQESINDLVNEFIKFKK